MQTENVLRFLELLETVWDRKKSASSRILKSLIKNFFFCEFHWGSKFAEGGGGGGEFARDATAVIQIRCDTWLAIAKKYMA